MEFRSLVLGFWADAGDIDATRRAANHPKAELLIPPPRLDLSESRRECDPVCKPKVFRHANNPILGLRGGIGTMANVSHSYGSRTGWRSVPSGRLPHYRRQAASLTIR